MSDPGGVSVVHAIGIRGPSILLVSVLLGWMNACGSPAEPTLESALPLDEPPLAQGLVEVYHVVGGNETRP